MSRRNVLILVVVIILILAGVVWYYRSTVSGGAVRTQCIDTDEGKDYFEKGQVEYKGEVIEDTCKADTLVEAYCKTTITGRFYGAIERRWCGDGCVDGACIYGEKEKATPQ